MVALRTEGGEVPMRSVRGVIAKLQALVCEGAGETEGDSVEWLLQERRREVAMDEAEDQARHEGGERA